MKKKQKQIKRLVHIILGLLLLVVTVTGGQLIKPAFADTGQYTNVIEDLSKDETFNINHYPMKLKDYSLGVIQIAESENGELFVYVYQPSAQTGNLKATEINMSLSETVNGTKLYKLKLVSSAGVYFKYLVEGVQVSTEATRYYNISSIYRNWEKDKDEGTGNGNTVNGVSYKVGQLWAATTTGGAVNYSMTYTDTVEITDKFVGSVRYPNGVSWFTTGACDSHFVAFSTDRRIDKLLEADVTFIKKTYDKTIFGTAYGNPEEVPPLTLKYDDVTGNTVNGIFAKTYTWKRIQSVSEFISDKDFAADAKAEISKQQWVLNFYETDYKSGIGGATAIVTGLFGTLISAAFSSGTLVSEVSVLRLKFETEGKTYNLGVVDNKQTGSDKPVGQPAGTGVWAFIGECFAKTFTGSGTWWQIAIVVLLIVLAIIAVCLVVRFARFVIESFKGKKE